MIVVVLVAALLVVAWAAVGALLFQWLMSRPRRQTEFTVATSARLAGGIGTRITGPGIPPNTYIARVPTATSLTVATGGRWLRLRLWARRAWTLRREGRRR